MLELDQEIVDILDGYGFVVNEIAEPFVVEVVADNLTRSRFAFTLEEKVDPADT